MVVNHGDITSTPDLVWTFRVVSHPTTPCQPTTTSKSPSYAIDPQKMASLIKKIVSGADRIPEGIQRAQATIQGTRSFDRHGPHPCLPPSDRGFLSSTLRPDWTRTGGLNVQLVSGSPRDFISEIVRCMCPSVFTCCGQP